MVSGIGVRIYGLGLGFALMISGLRFFENIVQGLHVGLGL